MPIQLSDVLFKTLLELINGTNKSITDPHIIVERALKKYEVDLENCNSTNLLVSAIKAYRENLDVPMIVMLKRVAGEASFDKALNSVDQEAEIVDIAILQTEPAAIEPTLEDTQEKPLDPLEVHNEEGASETIPTPQPVRTIFDAVGDNGNDLQNIIERMKDCSADINQKEDKFTPIQIAAINGFKEAVQTLHEAGADTTGLNVAAFIGDNEAVLNYLINAKVYTAEELTFESAKSDEYTHAFKKLLITLPGGVAVYLNETGLNALHVATKEGATENINAAIESGISLESKTKEDFTALQLAVIHDQDSAFDTLKARGADLFVEKEGASILHLAAFHNAHNVTTKILQSEQGPELAKQQDQNGDTPLHTASSSGSQNVIKAMLNNLPQDLVNQLINAQNYNGVRALSMTQDEGIQVLLKEYGAIERTPQEAVGETEEATSIAPTTAPSTPNAKIKTLPTSAPQTPASAIKIPLSSQKTEKELLKDLITAVNDDNADRVQEILTRSPNPKELINASLSIGTPGATSTIGTDLLEADSNSQIQENINILFFAHFYNKTKALDVLKNVWLDPNLQTLTKMLSTNNCDEIKQLLNDTDTKYLRDAKFSIIANKYTNNVSHELARNTDEAICVAFSDKFNASTLLHVATALTSDPDIILTLVGLGLDINAKDMNGYTPIHYVVERGDENSYINIAKACMKSGANLTMTSTKTQHTPIDMAVSLGYTKMLSNGLVGQNIDKITYYHLRLAIKTQHPDMVSVISDKRPDFLNKCLTATKETALMEAAKTGNEKIFHAVFKASSTNMMLDTTIIHKNSNQQTILHYIAQYGNLDMLVETMDKKDKIQALIPLKDAQGNTALHLLATREGTVYGQLKYLLSEYTVTTTVKTGWFGMQTKTTTTKCSDVRTYKNKDHQTPDDIHRTTLQKIAADQSKKPQVDLDTDATTESHSDEVASYHVNDVTLLADAPVGVVLGLE